MKTLEEEIEFLRIKILQLETELKELKQFRVLFTDFTRPEINKLKRRVSNYIHPDHGGNNDVMRDFNVLIDKLLSVVNAN